MEDRKFPRLMLMAVCLLLAALIGIGRYHTGNEFALSLFFLLPIYLATTFWGRSAGIVVAVACTASWLAADLALVSQFSRPWIPFVNEALRLTVFLFVVYILDHQKKSMELLSQMAETDPLTGIGNRRAFYSRAGVELDRATLLKLGIAAIYIDIDDFKQINDRLGHAAGDRLLVETARTLGLNLRSGDRVARLGGDEFVVLLPATDEAAAEKVAEKLARELANAAASLGMQVSFSLGIAAFSAPPRDIDELLQVADRRMYEAKRKIHLRS